MDPNTQPCNLAVNSLPTWHGKEDGGGSCLAPPLFSRSLLSRTDSAVAPSLAHLKHSSTEGNILALLAVARRQRGPNPFKCLDKLVASAARKENFTTFQCIT